jgi:hypothetical protein
VLLLLTTEARFCYSLFVANNNTEERAMNETTKPTMITTHEAYIFAVRDLAIARLPEGEKKTQLANAKMVYGAGAGMGARGVTFFAAWQNGQAHDFIEVCATGEESDVQLAGTTIHELAHVLAGNTAGHGAEWKAACKVLGLIAAEAAGQQYAADHFDADLFSAIAKLSTPEDGRPVFLGRGIGGRTIKAPRPCTLGIGTRGGKSRGAGSGSRMRLYVCACEKPVKVRVASDTFDATCNACHSAFTRAESSTAAAAPEAA